MRPTKESCGVLTLIALFLAPCGQSHKANGPDTRSEARFHPSPEMGRLQPAQPRNRDSFQALASVRILSLVAADDYQKDNNLELTQTGTVLQVP
jgi:hypothetical protein